MRYAVPVFVFVLWACGDGGLGEELTPEDAPDSGTGWSFPPHDDGLGVVDLDAGGEAGAGGSTSEAGAGGAGSELMPEAGIGGAGGSTIEAGAGGAGGESTPEAGTGGSSDQELPRELFVGTWSVERDHVRGFPDRVPGEGACPAADEDDMAVEVEAADFVELDPRTWEVDLAEEAFSLFTSAKFVRWEGSTWVGENTEEEYLGSTTIKYTQVTRVWLGGDNLLYGFSYPDEAGAEALLKTPGVSCLCKVYKGERL